MKFQPGLNSNLSTCNGPLCDFLLFHHSDYRSLLLWKKFLKIGKKQEQINEKAEFVEKVTFEPLDKFQTKRLWKLLQPL